MCALSKKNNKLLCHFYKVNRKMFLWNIILIITIIITSYGIYSYLLGKVELFKKSGVPCLKPWPIIGNMGPILMKQMSLGHLLEKLYFLNTKAKYVGYFEFTTPIIVVRDPEIIKSIGTKNYDNFYNRRGFAEKADNLLIGNDLFSLKNENWREMNRILSPSFTLNKFKQFYQLIATKTQDSLKFIHKNGETETRMKSLFQKLVFDIIFPFAFGIRTNFIRNEGIKKFASKLNGLNPESVEKLKLFKINYPFIFKILRFKYFTDTQREYFQNIINLRLIDKKTNLKSNMIDMMMDAKQDGKNLSMDEMSGQIFAMFGGGFNLSDSLAYISYYIAVNSHVQIKLQQEIDQLSSHYNVKSIHETFNDEYSNSTSKVIFDDIMNLKYLDAVFKEAMRLQTQIVSLERICSKPFQLPPSLPGLRPFTLKPGMIISIPIESIHRDSKYFEKPDKFNPDRFYNINDKTIFNSYTYLPFGVGPRHCIANRFSTQTMKIVIFYILANFNLQTCSRTQIPLKINRRKFTKSPDKSIILRIEKRIKCTDNDK